LLGIKYIGQHQTGKYISTVFEKQEMKVALTKK